MHPDLSEELRKLREAAIDASLKADRLEEEARRARRRATARHKAYEDRLQNAQRQVIASEF